MLTKMARKVFEIVELGSKKVYGLFKRLYEQLNEELFKDRAKP